MSLLVLQLPPLRLVSDRLSGASLGGLTYILLAKLAELVVEAGFLGSPGTKARALPFHFVLPLVKPLVKPLIKPSVEPLITPLVEPLVMPLSLVRDGSVWRFGRAVNSLEELDVEEERDRG